MNRRLWKYLGLTILCWGWVSVASAANITFVGNGGQFQVPYVWIGDIRMADLTMLGEGLGIPVTEDSASRFCTWSVSPGISVRFDVGSAFVALPTTILQFGIEVQRFENAYYAPLIGVLELLSDLGYRVAYRPELDQVQFRQQADDLSGALTGERNKWAFDVIVIDPGHGGKDPGAIGSKKTKEKDITLQVAKRLKPLLENRLHVRVVMTRDKDKFVPLSERGNIANSAGGKLFVSLHCNAARNRRARGIETYFLAPARRERALQVALAENSVIHYEETTTQYPDLTDEGYILTAMAQSHFMKESEYLASVVQNETSRALNLPNRGVDQAGFYVLIGASMPGILFEMGFISNKKEEMLLRSAEFQKELAEALLKSIEAFIARYSGS
jgi:N-acetylmuramoyl-L-alanine amidase